MSYLDKLLDGVGVEWKTLGELGSFYGGLTGKSKGDFKDGNAKFITYMNIYNNPALQLDIDATVVINENERQNQVLYGDILFTGSSETPEECGMSSVVTTHPKEKLYLNSFCFGFRLNDTSLFIPDFLKHLFRSDSLRKQITPTASGVTRFNISKAKFAKIIIPIPCPEDPKKSLEIQSKIVHILDKFSTLTAELQAELQARKSQYEYYRNQLLNYQMKEPDQLSLCSSRSISFIQEDSNQPQQTSIPNYPTTNSVLPPHNKVEWIKLGEIGEIRMCKRIFKEQTFDVGDIPFYKIGTFGKEPNAYISRDLFNEYKLKYSYPKVGDILISASGTIGKAVVFNGKDAYFQDSNIVWIDNNEKKVLNKYLFYCYQIAKWKISEGGTIQRLYNDNLKETMIPVPYIDDQRKSLEIQSNIVGILDKFDTLTNSISEGLPKEIELRQKQYEYYRNMLLSFSKE